MKPDALGLPTIILPYPGPAQDEAEQDIFVYLRPETNGVIAESTILRVVKAANKHTDKMSLIYLANFPGEFIVKNKIVEQYYGLRLHFAVQGKSAFTETMKRRFEHFFNTDFANANIVGAFDALNILGLSPEALFDLWVPASDFVSVNGQIIKHYKDMYIVNYDIPALLHKNSANTDIALMIFRTKQGYDAVQALVADMHKALCDIQILSPEHDAARAFHYSKSPLEQLLDGVSYLFPASDGNLKLTDLSFGRYALSKNIDINKLFTIMRNPIVLDEEADGDPECNFYNRSMFTNYDETIKLISHVKLLKPIIHHSNILDAFSANSF